MPTENTAKTEDSESGNKIMPFVKRHSSNFMPFMLMFEDTAQPVDSEVGKKIKPFVTRQSSKFMPFMSFMLMFRNKNMKDRTQTKNTTRNRRNLFSSILKKNIILRIRRSLKLISTQKRNKTGQKGKQDTQLVKKNSFY